MNERRIEHSGNGESWSKCCETDLRLCRYAYAREVVVLTEPEPVKLPDDRFICVDERGKDFFEFQFRTVEMAREHVKNAGGRPLRIFRAVWEEVK